MIELFKNALTGQFQAALSMFNACVSQCSEDKWEGDVGNFPFWHVAYHTLYYTDMYLSRDEDFALAAKAAGLEYRELVKRIVSLGLRYRTNGTG